MDITIRDLRYFLATAHMGSLGLAAQKCHVTQPALSKSISRIETLLNQKLFVRSSMGMALTSAGEDFHRYASRVNQEHEEVMRYVQSCRKGLGGLLKIGSTRPIFDGLLSKALIKMIEVTPEVRFELELGAADDLVTLLENGLLDMVLAPIKKQVPPSIETHTLGVDRVFVIARSGHPASLGQSLELEELFTYDWILPKKNATAYKWFEERFHAAGLAAPLPKIEVDYAGPAVLQIVHATDCLLYVPGNWNIDLPDGLKKIHISALNASRTICLATRKNTYWSAVMNKLHTVLKSISKTTTSTDNS